jgi:selenocysteine lyase/cysteine desulfurase
MLTQTVNWRAGDNIIVPDRTFPAIVMPAKLLGQRDVDVKVVDTVDGLISEDKLIEAIDDRSRMMIVPLVNFLTGQRLDVPGISKACRDAGVFLVVDAIQAVGPMNVDVKELGCHSLCFGSPKWLFGPMGVGTIYIDLDVLEELHTPQVGMCSVPDPWNFFDYDQPLNVDCARFECGCSAHLSHHGIRPNLEMLLDLGPGNTQKYLLELTGYLHDELTGRGAKVLTPREDDRRAAIITFDARSAGWDDAQTLFNTLTEQHINVAVRMGLVRVSPHFYNEVKEVDKLLAAVFR